MLSGSGTGGIGMESGGGGMVIVSLNKSAAFSFASAYFKPSGWLCTAIKEKMAIATIVNIILGAAFMIWKLWYDEITGKIKQGCFIYYKKSLNPGWNKTLYILVYV